MPGGSIPGLSHAMPTSLPAAPSMAEDSPLIVPGRPAPPTLGSPLAAPVDLEVLVEKVQRKILRRLAAERERKGGLE